MTGATSMAWAPACRQAPRMSSGGDRARELLELRLEVEVLKNLLHLAKEVHAFKSYNAYHHSAGLAVNVDAGPAGRKSFSL